VNFLFLFPQDGTIVYEPRSKAPGQFPCSSWRPSNAGNPTRKKNVFALSQATINKVISCCPVGGDRSLPRFFASCRIFLPAAAFFRFSAAVYPLSGSFFCSLPRFFAFLRSWTRCEDTGTDRWHAGTANTRQEGVPMPQQSVFN